MDDDFAPISNVDEAAYIAGMWAHHADADTVRARSFAKEWFEKTEPAYRNRLHLLVAVKGFMRTHQRASAQWAQHLAIVLQQATQWDIEVVRHLAALNGAGLAGSAALLAATRFSDSVSVRIALLAFAVGLILAVLNLWLNAQGYVVRLDYVRRRKELADDAGTWAELTSGGTPAPKGLRPDDWHEIAIHVGWTSAIFGILGATLLGIALF